MALVSSFSSDGSGTGKREHYIRFATRAPMGGIGIIPTGTWFSSDKLEEGREGTPEAFHLHSPHNLGLCQNCSSSARIR